jgi:hypothetical protein
MLEKATDLADGAVGNRASRGVTGDDDKNVLIPAVEAFGKGRPLYALNDDTEALVDFRRGVAGRQGRPCDARQRGGLDRFYVVTIGRPVPSSRRTLPTRQGNAGARKVTQVSV